MPPISDGIGQTSPQCFHNILILLDSCFETLEAEQRIKP
nr:MAG TPA: hypothetical protein [Caudoviricetes sp.]